MDAFSEFKSTFFAECDELLAVLETKLTDLQEGRQDDDTLNAIFRAVHSIKAGAGSFKFDALVAFSHVFEAVLDRLRTGTLPLSDDLLTLLFQARDILADRVDAARHDIVLTMGHGRDVRDALGKLADIDYKDVPIESAQSAAPTSGPPADAETGACRYRIDFAPKADMFRHANEPLLIIRELKSLGRLVVSADISALPALADMNPEDAYLSWRFELETAHPLADIEEVFEFVTEDCRLSITALDDAPVPASTQDVDEVPAPDVTGPAAGGTPASRSTAVSSIRVDLERVDRLVNMVGEILISQSMLSQEAADLPRDQFGDIVRRLDDLSFRMRHLQDGVMAIRMQPVKSVFARMPRLVRELSAKLGKDVRLVTSGENTEIDKTVIEELSDPITHMIRNSLDHGLEDAAERQAAGKPAKGSIWLSAEHAGGSILITIRDDGKGINRQRVLEIARSKGLVAPNVTPPDEDIDALIFAPGFSTAEEVTDISGRGVGMDVVRRNIESLGGRVGIRSKPGEGTTFTMTLPLTLAVMDGMIVSLGGSQYIIPISAIKESVRPAPQDVNTLPDGGQVMSIRGSYIPLIYPGHTFGIEGSAEDPSQALVVVAEAEGQRLVGVVVDELMGQQQVVIKSLEENYDHIQGIAAVTILGNGQVAPILDIEGLRRLPQGPGPVGGYTEPEDGEPSADHPEIVETSLEAAPAALEGGQAL